MREPPDPRALTFRFESPYDVIGAPQDASRQELERLRDETLERLRGTNDFRARQRIEDAAARLLDEDARDRLDQELSTRFYATQDICHRVDTLAENTALDLELLIGGPFVAARDFSELTRRGRLRRKRMSRESSS